MLYVINCIRVQRRLVASTSESRVKNKIMYMGHSIYFLGLGTAVVFPPFGRYYVLSSDVDLTGLVFDWFERRKRSIVSIEDTIEIDVDAA